MFVDLDNKKISLTLQPHVVEYNLPSFSEAGVDAGDIYEEAEVLRVDKGIGLALQLPTEPAINAYVHVRPRLLAHK